MKLEKKEFYNYDIYNVKFANLTDLYTYLKSNPKINYDVFETPSSYRKSDFYGESLERSIEYLRYGYTKDFDNFLEISNELKKIGIKNEDDFHTIRTLHGGVPLAPLVASGVNDCMLSSVRNQDSSVITIYFQLGYPSGTSDNQIINRGLATLYIIEALEAKGYLVNFKAFELSCEGNEIVNIGINLKKPGDLFLNVEKCYFPMKGKEFLRRILFRVLESVPVKNYEWGYSYGSSMTKEEIKKIFDTKKKDLIISQPREMGIKGNDIYKDTTSLIRNLNIESEFDMKKLEKKLKY